MSRTNIEIDDQLISNVMIRYSFKTKRQAVEYALKRLVGPPVRPEAIEELRGIGWEPNLDEMRESKIQ